MACVGSPVPVSLPHVDGHAAASAQRFLEGPWDNCGLQHPTATHWLVQPIFTTPHAPLLGMLPTPSSAPYLALRTDEALTTCTVEPRAFCPAPLWGPCRSQLHTWTGAQPCTAQLLSSTAQTHLVQQSCTHQSQQTDVHHHQTLHVIPVCWLPASCPLFQGSAERAKFNKASCSTYGNQMLFLHWN